MATWPSSLPQNIEVRGLNIGLPDGSVRTDMDSGPSFSRQRFTAAPEPFSGQVTLDETQYQTLRDFYVTGLSHGALNFDWQHPITKNAAELRFRSAPRVSAISGKLLRVSLELEVLP